MTFALRPIALAYATAAAVLIAAVAAGATALTPPVMHESFTVLPCPKNPTTTLALEGCAEHQIIAEDRTIDALDAKIFARLRTSRLQREFVAGHTAWLAYRRTYCTAFADSLSTGTLNPVAFAGCEVDRGRERVSALRTYYGDLTGD